MVPYPWYPRIIHPNTDSSTEVWGASALGCGHELQPSRARAASWSGWGKAHDRYLDHDVSPTSCRVQPPATLASMVSGIAAADHPDAARPVIGAGRHRPSAVFCRDVQ